MPLSVDEVKAAIIITTAIMVFLVFFIMFLFFAFQFRKKKARQLLEKEIMTARIEIQEQTFKNLSQEIHDNVGQVLSLAKLNLNTAIAGISTEKETLKIESATDLITRAIGDLRNISRGMLGDKVTETGLQVAIENELKILQNTGQFKTDFQVSGPNFRLDEQKEVMVFRMVQEAISNCIKYAKAKTISIRLINASDKYHVSVHDDGIGFDVSRLQSKDTG